MYWSHEDDCVYGTKIFQHVSGKRYFVVVFFKCRWWCEGQAWYRIQKVSDKALAYEDELAWDFKTATQIDSTIKHRAQRRNKGFYALKLVGSDKKLVVASPEILKLPSTLPPQQVILTTSTIAIDTGIERLTKAKKWGVDEAAGHTPLNIPAIEDKSRLESAMKKVGLRHGKLDPPRPVEILERQLREVLGIDGVDWP